VAVTSSYEAASTVLMFALDCLQARGRCDGVRSFVSPGIAAYDCDQLTARILPRKILSKTQCLTVSQLGVELQLVRCCVPVGDADNPPDPLAVDAAARCIYDDLDSLFECMICEDAAISAGAGSISCDGLTLDGIEYDTAPSGTCYGGRIRVYLQVTTCC
jgi:hypothetical protein